MRRTKNQPARLATFRSVHAYVRAQAANPAFRRLRCRARLHSRPRRESSSVRPRNPARRTSWRASGRPCCRACRRGAGGDVRSARGACAAAMVRSLRFPAHRQRPEAAGGSETVLSNAQPLYDAAVDEMLLDDFVNVFLVDVRVPDRFRIHDHHRTFFASVHAAGLIDANFFLARQAKLLDAALGIVTHLLRTMVVTARAGIVALVAAEEYVIAVIAH